MSCRCKLFSQPSIFCNLLNQLIISARVGMCACASSAELSSCSMSSERCNSSLSYFFSSIFVLRSISRLATLFSFCSTERICFCSSSTLLVSIPDLHAFFFRIAAAFHVAAECAFWNAHCHEHFGLTNVLHLHELSHSALET